MDTFANDGTDSWAMAPMSPAISVITWLLLLLPPALVATGLFGPDRVARWILVGSGVATAGLYAGIWLWLRPRRLSVGPEGLRITFPAREKSYPREAITDVRRVGTDETGTLLRTCGAGGLWGGFGWFWSRRLGTVLAYVSRADGLVLVRLGERKLLLSPERPDEFVRRLGALLEA